MASLQIVRWEQNLRPGARRLATFVVEIRYPEGTAYLEGELLLGMGGSLYTRPSAESLVSTLDGQLLAVALRWPRWMESDIERAALKFWRAGRGSAR